MFNRCLYVVQEIERVQQASNDLQNNNLADFGRKMLDTHHGLSKLYEVSCEELDFLVDNAKAFPGVLGARMMGGGFGGCTINLVKKQNLDDFINHLKVAYKTKFNIDMEYYRVEVMQGTHVLKPKIEMETYLSD